MRTFSLPFLFLAMSFFLLLGCEKTQEKEPFETDLRLELAGLELQAERKFRVDSILFKLGTSGLERDTQSYEFTETIIDTVRRMDGDLQFIVERQIFSLNQNRLTGIQQVSRRLHGQTLIHAENNLSYITLSFPPRINRRWKGLSLFPNQDLSILILGEPIRPYKDWSDFRITEDRAAFSIDEKTWSDVVSVIQADLENAIERRYSIERYAPGEGLIYKEQIILDTQNISTAPWEEKAERGFILKMYRI